MQQGSTFLINHSNCLLEAYNDPWNRRIRVDDYRGSIDKILEKAGELAVSEKAEKLIVKARREHFTRLLEHGFRFEASVDGYFLGSDGWFFSKFYTSERKNNLHWVTEDEIIKNVYHLKEPARAVMPPKDYQPVKLQRGDAPALASLYNQVFQIYPTPLNDAGYIEKTMEQGTIYYGFVCNGEIVSAASAEVNNFYKNAELTDCATLKEHRKHGLMKHLLALLEDHLLKNSIYCAYSIARSLSFGMNAALFQLGYAYRGRLINNCFIYDKLENMNVWVKDLASSALKG
ncbi:putative beta-lysine N-acetyltransferase [Bacillus sp. T33-2]|uniref:putative beta-lysine N-acetyltransferase n=1 Tax=Bacillus sp. T33-2 TaxID=2054168 RepID=UPI000C784598|nr:putative beta-lysine N-acetyltransferase [Bacillus sp. T33-2]PLR98871.1 putative beta-lysine N-acetyltransferase [Bacillus sp. T33-2]